MNLFFNILFIFARDIILIEYIDNDHKKVANTVKELLMTEQGIPEVLIKENKVPECVIKKETILQFCIDKSGEANVLNQRQHILTQNFSVFRI